MPEPIPRAAPGSDHRPGPFFATALALLATACEDGATGDVATIEETRLVAAPYRTARPGTTLRQRIFGPSGVNPNSVAASDRMQTPPVAPFVYDVPEGWTPLQPRPPFRQINLQHESDPRAEWTLAMYPDRGGLSANINRWRRQVGLGPLTESEVAALPKRRVFNDQATLLEVYGPYSGMGGASIEDGGLRGAIFARQGVTLFVKMVGPREIVESSGEAFGAFLDSLGLDAESTPAGPSLAWSGPDGWTEEPSRSQFREVTFRRDELEMYVSLARGGVKDNVNRWASQLGKDPLDDGELAALERVPSLGGTAVVYDASGALRGMRDPVAKENQRMTAAVVNPPGRGDVIVTLKLTGPDEDVVAARTAFDAVLASLEFTGGTRAAAGPGESNGQEER